MKMTDYCRNHPDKKALSFCHSCKEYFCAACLEEGDEYYYCQKEACKEAKQAESSAHEEVARSKNTESPKILIDGAAVGFCDKCLEATSPTPVSQYVFSLRNAILVNEREMCETCGSVIMDLKESWPILSFIWRNIGAYRIIKTWDIDPDALYLHRDKYIGREII